MLAQQSLKAADADAALVQLFRAEQDDPDSPKVHIDIGRIYLALDRRDEARRAFTRARQLDEDGGMARLGLALIAEKDDAFDLAAVEALEAVKRDAALPEAHALIGRMMRREEKLAEAADAFRVALRLAPKMKYTHYQLVEVLQALGKEAEAQKHLNAFVALHVQEEEA